MKFIIIFISILYFIIGFSFANEENFENLFYITQNSKNSLSTETIDQIKTHSKYISIIAPQIYKLNSIGEIKGVIDPELLSLANNYKIKLMPLIINQNFNQDVIHHFLNDSAAENKAIQYMLRLCKKYNFYGFQFDLENIHYTDKDLLTQFVSLAAMKLHQQGYHLSIAIVPHLNEDSDRNPYYKWVFENWSGAYDASKLAKSTDFISVMAYDNHTSLTTPGPIAPINWDENILRDLLKTIPKEKISLGIPAYSGYWTTGKIKNSLAKALPEEYSFRSKEFQIDYTKLQQLVAASGKQLIWNNETKSYYSIYSKDELFEYIFAEEARSFQAKLTLAKQLHLRGISVWKLGMEDPQLWKDFTG